MIVLILKGLSTSHDVKSEFETGFTDFNKIRNVVRVQNEFFFYKAKNGEWTNETMVVFKSNKAAYKCKYSTEMYFLRDNYD